MPRRPSAPGSRASARGRRRRACSSLPPSLLRQIDEVFYVVRLGDDPAQGHVEMVCGRSEQITGCRPTEFLTDPGLWFSLLHPEDAPAVAESTRSILASGRPGVRQYRLRHRGTGQWRWIEDRMVPGPGRSGRVVRLLGAAYDVTDRRRAEDALRASETRFRTLVASMDDIVFTLDREQRHTGVFGRWLKREGLSAGTFLGRTARQVLGPEAAPVHEAANARALAGESLAYEWTAEGPGGRRYFSTSLSPLREDGEVAGVVGVGREITARVQAEQALRASEEALRQLSSRLLHLQDEERRRIARELHDATGQSLVGLVLRLATLEKTAEPGLRRELRETRALAESCAREVRTLSHLLHPPLLDEAGLTMALRWFVDGFAERSGIRTELELPESLGRLPRDVEAALYRIVQEGLTNVHRHSGSPVASVCLKRGPGWLRLEVVDRGKGLGREERSQAPGLGLAGMRERVRELGGRLEIDSGPSGTTLRALVPLGPEQKA